MAGERNLGALLRAMQPTLSAETWAFVMLPPEHPVPVGLDPVMTFREAEGLTLIVPERQAATAGLEATFTCRMVTRKVHSALDAVGFMAAITTRLAAAGIAVNPVSAFRHDHLFVPADRADEVVELPRRIAADAAEPVPG